MVISSHFYTRLLNCLSMSGMAGVPTSEASTNTGSYPDNSAGFHLLKK